MRPAASTLLDDLDVALSHDLVDVVTDPRAPSRLLGRGCSSCELERLISDRDRVTDRLLSRLDEREVANVCQDELEHASCRDVPQDGTIDDTEEREAVDDEAAISIVDLAFDDPVCQLEGQLIRSKNRGPAECDAAIV